MKLKVTYQEKLERIKLLKGYIKEQYSLVPPKQNKERYILKDILSESIFTQPNHQALCELIAYQEQLDVLLEEVNLNK